MGTLLKWRSSNWFNNKYSRNSGLHKKDQGISLVLFVWKIGKVGKISMETIEGIVKRQRIVYNHITIISLSRRRKYEKELA